MKTIGLLYAVSVLAVFLILWGINGFLIPRNLDDAKTLLFLLAIASVWPLSLYAMVKLTHRGD